MCADACYAAITRNLLRKWESYQIKNVLSNVRGGVINVTLDFRQLLSNNFFFTLSTLALLCDTSCPPTRNADPGPQ